MEYVPAPSGDLDAPLKALIFDSIYDSYRGVVLNVRITDGMVKPGDKIKLMSNGKTFDVTEVGVFSPKAVARDFLMVGDVGYITASIKTVQDTRVGDTVTLADNPAAEALPGYRKMNPMVYCGLYPIDTSRYNDLREALEKLQLNDAATIRTRNLSSIRFWVPLWIPRTSSYGCRPRTLGTGIQSRIDHDCTIRYLPC